MKTIVIFIAVMGGLFGRIFTPTEAGAIGAFATLMVALIRRNINWGGFSQALFETTRITCMILVIVAGATVFGKFLAVSRIPYDIANWVLSFNLPPAVIRGFIVLVYLAVDILSIPWP